MKLPYWLTKFRHAFSPQPQIAGLDISPAGLHLFLLRGEGVSKSVSVPLTPDILVDGRIKNSAQFIAALKQLHEKISQPNHPINVIVSIPSQLIYTQAFAVPAVAKENLEEAIDLNLQMISPSRIEETFYDWQELKEGSDARHLDLLGAFAPEPAVRAYLNTLAESGFNVVAVEFPALALARLVKERYSGLDPTKHYLLVHLNNAGLLLCILKNGNLAFSQFSPWTGILANPEKGEITFLEIKTFLAQEIQRVLNYYFGRTNQTLTEAILISPFFNYEIVDLGKTLNLNIHNLSFGENLPAYWLVAMGAALRGLTERAHDTAISLTEANTQAEYYRERTLTFLSIWRNIATVTLSFLLVALVTIDTAFLRQERKLEGQALTELTASGQTEITALETQAARFNNLLAAVEQVRAKENQVSPLLINLQTLSGGGISFDRLVFDRPSLTVLISGQALNELTAINFKNRLSRQENVESVVLPLANLKTLSDGTVGFVLTLKLKLEAGVE